MTQLPGNNPTSIPPDVKTVVNRIVGNKAAFMTYNISRIRELISYLSARKKKIVSANSPLASC
ncbi:MAG: hypothetical protein JRH15_16775 [Deltaproteobacteria bacterium]|nr:hypothetical protein [Deltaproteobacteria bacterium]